MTSRLYVGNISFDTTEDTLKEVFGQDSRGVEGVDIVADRDTGRPRGFAFVQMASEADANSAVAALDGTELDGRKLRVDLAKDKQPRGDGRGRDREAW